jgi:hypothetical protein
MNNKLFGQNNNEPYHYIIDRKKAEKLLSKHDLLAQSIETCIRCPDCNGINECSLCYQRRRRYEASFRKIVRLLMRAH